MEKLGDRSNDPLPLFARKVKETGFLWSLRIVIQGEKSERQRILQKIQLVLSPLSGDNGFVYRKVISLKHLIQEMQLHQFSWTQSQTQIMTISELLPFFSLTQKESVVVPIQQEEVLQSIGKLSVPVAPHPFGSVIEYLPHGSSRENTDDPKESMVAIQQAFQKIGLYPHGLEFLKIQTGATLQKFTFRLPSGLKLNTIEKEARNLEAELGVHGVSIERGDIAGTAALSLALAERQTIWLRDLLNDPTFLNLEKKAILPVIIGRTDIGELLLDRLERLKHVLVCGATGSGKSMFLTQLIASLLLCRSPEQFRLYLIDPKKVELSVFRHCPHVVQIETEPNRAVHLLEQITKEMDRRYEAFSKLGVRHLDTYNSKVQKPLPRLVVVIDEFADLILTNRSVEQPVVRLGQLARACGIHLILSTQRPSVDVVTGLIKANLPSRIVFMCSSPHDYKTCLDGKPPILLGQGDGVAQLEGRSTDGLIRFQAPILTLDDEELELIIESISSRWKGDVPEFHLPEIECEGTSVEVTDDLTRIKQYIQQTGITSGTTISKELKLRRKVVSDAMVQLVEDGWLLAPEKNGLPYCLTFPFEKTFENKK